MNQAAFDAALALEYTRFSADPLGFVRFNYPWGEGELAEHPGPRAWQAEQLDTIGRHLRNPESRFQPIRSAIASGHGIGKSALVAYCRVISPFFKHGFKRVKGLAAPSYGLRKARRADRHYHKFLYVHV